MLAEPQIQRYYSPFQYVVPGSALACMALLSCHFCLLDARGSAAFWGTAGFVKKWYVVDLEYIRRQLRSAHANARTMAKLGEGRRAVIGYFFAAYRIFVVVLCCCVFLLSWSFGFARHCPPDTALTSPGRGDWSTLISIGP